MSPLIAISTDPDQRLYIALREIWSMACHTASARLEGGRDYGWRINRVFTDPGVKVITSYVHEAQGLEVEQVSRADHHTITLSFFGEDKP